MIFVFIFFFVVIASMKACLEEYNERDITARAKAKPAKFSTGLWYVASIPSNSIAVLFVCESRLGMKNLFTFYVSGKLQSMLEDMFTSLLVADNAKVTRVHVKKLVWELSDYCRCFWYFDPHSKREYLSFICHIAWSYLSLFFAHNFQLHEHFA